MPRARSHIGAEPIVDQGFAWRSLLLYYALTGEEWARDLAKQNIDRLVYYATTRPKFVLDGGRPTAWMLRAALAGAEWFPEDRSTPTRRSPTRSCGSSSTTTRRAPAPAGPAAGVAGADGRGARRVSPAHRARRRRRRHRRRGAPPAAPTACAAAPTAASTSVLLRRRRTAAAQPGPTRRTTSYLWLGVDRLRGHALARSVLRAVGRHALHLRRERRSREHRDIRGWTSVLGFPHWFLDVAARK